MSEVCSPVRLLLLLICWCVPVAMLVVVGVLVLSLLGVPPVEVLGDLGAGRSIWLA